MNRPAFQALVFDMDGTLTRPTIDFDAIRREIGLPAGDLAHGIMAMPPTRRDAAWAVVKAHEKRAIDEQELQEGTRDLLLACRAAATRIGIVTRNTQESVEILCRKFDLPVDAVVSREFPHIKPHPGPILHLLEQWTIPATGVLTIGDYIHDIECGRAAGTRTCFFRNPGKADYSTDADFSVSSMRELQAIVFPEERAAKPHPVSRP